MVNDFDFTYFTVIHSTIIYYESIYTGFLPNIKFGYITAS